MGKREDLKLPSFLFLLMEEGKKSRATAFQKHFSRMDG